jgi:hypothetical protein
MRVIRPPIHPPIRGGDAHRRLRDAPRKYGLAETFAAESFPGPEVCEAHLVVLGRPQP